MKELDPIFYTSYPPAWKAMLEACEAATRSIDCEQFIFEEDEVGRLFGEVFKKKVAEGVRVRMLLDGVGSSALVGSSYALELIRGGILLRFHNRIKPWPVRFTPHFFRTHRKILVIDGEKAFVGGMGIAARMRHWRDTQIQVVGDTAKIISRSFQRMWESSIRRQLRRFEKPDDMLLYQVYTNAPRFLGRHLYHALLKRIQKAKRSVYLSTGYFVPNVRLVHALRRVAKRGVEVKIIVPLASDVRIADIAAGSYFERLLKDGVQIYRYQGNVFHTKAAVIDESWAMLGSANLDNLSLLFNYELDVGSSKPVFVNELSEEFKTDLMHAELLDLVRWQNRPLLLKWKEFFVRAIHSFL